MARTCVFANDLPKIGLDLWSIDFKTSIDFETFLPLGALVINSASN
jgi:hypothetical protein